MITKQSFLGIVTSVALASPMATVAAMSEEFSQFTIENQTGADITYIFVSAGNSVNFGADILGTASPLGNKQEVEFSVHYPDHCNLFNILAIAANADYFSVFHYEICDGKKQRLRLGRNYYAGKKKVDRLTSIVFENGTSRSLHHLFLTPGETGIWGIDYLHGNSEVQPGQTARLRIMTPVDKVTYAVRAVNKDGQTFSFAIDLDGSMNEFVYEIVDEWMDVSGE